MNIPLIRNFTIKSLTCREIYDTLRFRALGKKSHWVKVLLPLLWVLPMTQSTGSEVSLTWQDNSNNESGFIIERSLDGKSFAAIAKTAENETSFVDTGLDESGTFKYRVCAFNAYGQSGYSNIENVEVSGSNETTSTSKRTVSIAGHKSDALLTQNGKAIWAGGNIYRVGGYSTEDGAIVIPFKIPNLASNETITGASFSINLSGKRNNPRGSVDVYGLKFRSSAKFSKNDYYQGAYAQDSRAWALQEAIVTGSTAVGRIASATSASTKIANYINKQIAAGAKPGDFIVLRLSPSFPNLRNYNFWSFKTADSATPPSLKLVISKTTRASIQSTSSTNVAMASLSSTSALLPTTSTSSLFSGEGLTSSTIGSPYDSGEYEYISETGLHLLSVSGKGYQADMDQLRFAYKKISGDKQIIVEIHEFATEGSASSVGIMLRNSLSSSSAHASITLSGDDYIYARHRDSDGSSHKTRNDSLVSESSTLLSLKKVSDVVTLSYSIDGEPWVDLESTQVSLENDTYFLGIAVGSYSEYELSGAVIEIHTLD